MKANNDNFSNLPQHASVPDRLNLLSETQKIVEKLQKVTNIKKKKIVEILLEHGWLMAGVDVISFICEATDIQPHLLNRKVALEFL